MDQLKHKEFSTLTTPHTFYCTFEHAQACKEVLKLGGIMLFGYPLKFVPANHPSDIIWSNHIKSSSRAIRILLLCVLAIFGTFGTLFSGFLTNINWQQYFSYLYTTPGINCNSVKASYGDSLIDMAYVET